MTLELAVKLFAEEGDGFRESAVRWRRAAIATIMLGLARKKLHSFPLPKGDTTRCPAAFQRGLAQGFDRRQLVDNPRFHQDLWDAFGSVGSGPSLEWLKSFAMLCLVMDLRWNEDFTVSTGPVLEPVFQHKRRVDDSGRTSVEIVRVI